MQNEIYYSIFKSQVMDLIVIKLSLRIYSNAALLKRK